MDLRLATSLALLLGAAHAQPPVPAVQDPAPAPAPAAQDPDKPKPTAEQEAQALAAERDRLQREIAYVRERAQHAKANLSQKFAPKAPTWKAIDAGVQPQPVAPVPSPAQRRPARVANPDELSDHGSDTMLVVNGRPVSQAQFDQVVEFLAQSPSTGDASMRAQRVLFDLIRIEAVAAAFQENEAAERTGDLLGQLDAGKSIQELAQSVGTVAGASPEGRVELTRNSMHGPVFEHAAFTTEAGKRARPFRNAHGLVILQVESVVKGETPDTDKVVLHAIQVPYTADAQALQKVHNSVNFGQVDLVVRDQQTLDLLPQLFRPMPAMPPAAPVPGRDTTAIEQALQQLTTEIAALQDATDDAAVARRAALQARYDQLKHELRAAAGDATEDQVEPVRIEPAPAPGKPKTDVPKSDVPKKQG